MKPQLPRDAHPANRSSLSLGRFGLWPSLVAALVLAAIGCGHVGVDLDGETLSVEDDTNDEDDTNKDDDTPTDEDDADDGSSLDDDTIDDGKYEDAGRTDLDASARDDSASDASPDADAPSDERDAGSWAGVRDASTDPLDAAHDEPAADAASDEPTKDDGSDDESTDDVLDDLIDDALEDDPIDDALEDVADDDAPTDDPGLDDNAVDDDDSNVDDDVNAVDDLIGDLRDAGLRGDADSASTDPSNLREPCVGACSCNIDESCEFACQEETCSPSCQAGSNCHVEVRESSAVNVDCAEDALCEAKSTTEAPLSLSCKGAGECIGRCGQSASCSMNCEQSTGKCVLYCEGADECEVLCPEGAECYVVRQNIDTLVELECSTDARLECSDTVTACNGACP